MTHRSLGEDGSPAVPCGQKDCLDHRSWMGFAFSGDIVGGPMAWRSSYERKTQRDIDHPLRRVELQGDHPLVMVGGQSEIVLAPDYPGENTVCGQRPGHKDPFSFQGPQGRRKERPLFFPDNPVVARMGIDSAGHQPRMSFAHLVFYKRVAQFC